MPSQNPSILLSIIVISYNTPKLVVNCLNSVIKEIENSNLLKNKTEVLIVDNNSDHESLEIISQFLSQNNSTAISFNLIKNQTNVGFAKANNQAIHKARGDFYLLLNSDTLIQAGSLTNLVSNLIWIRSHAQTNSLAGDLKNQKNSDQDRSDSFQDRSDTLLTQIGLLAGDLKNQDGSHQHQGGALPNLWTLKTHMLMLTKIPILGKLISSTQTQSLLSTSSIQTPSGQLKIQGWVGGACLLIPKDIYQKIGPLDENIFMYGEDTEYCLRAKKAGFTSAIDLSAPITHLAFGSSSSGQALIGEMTGLLYLFNKHLPTWQLPIAYNLLLIGCYLRIGLFGFLGLDQNKAQTYKQAVSELKKRYNML